MKNLCKVALSVLIGTVILLNAGCGKSGGESDGSQSGSASSKDDKMIVVAATLDPHSKILEFAKGILKEDYGYDLEIKVLDDYYIFNKALSDGEVDANYFQHVPFFEKEVEKNGYDIVNVAAIHIEPFGFYSKTITDLNSIPQGAKIIISNSVADHGRILSILEREGLIKLDEKVDKISAVVADIIENPKGLVFTEIKPEMLVRAFNENEGDLVAINGNYAIQAGINPVKDSLILEKADEENPYTNIIACQSDNRDSEKIKVLVEVLKSDAVREFIKKTYTNGSVIPASR